MTDETVTPPQAAPKNASNERGAAARADGTARASSATDTAANTGAETASAVPGEPAEIPPAQLRDIIKALQTEVDTWRDHALRARAETENVRKRLEREKEDLAKYAITKFARDIVTVGDNFQRAMSAVPAGAAENDAVKGIADGVSMIEREFFSVLGRHGVEKIDPMGEAFNPHRHQAVMENEDRNVAPGTIVQVFQCGYLLEDRVLRPAMVVVARGGSAAPAHDTESAPNGADVIDAAENSTD